METTTPTEDKKRKTFTRNCEECSKEYAAVLKNSRFCSGACRAKWNKKNPKAAVVETDEPAKPKDTSVPAQASPTPIFTGLSPHMQIAVNLLEKESKRWEDAYKEEKKLRIELEQERNRLKDEIRDTAHKTALEGIENEKPSMFERVLGSIPPQVMEHLAPVIGQIAQRLIPAPAEGLPMAGVEGQLDSGQIQFIQWVSALPEETQKKVIMLCTSMMQMKPEQADVQLTKIINLLKTGTSFNPNPMMNYGT